jgi:23S rRNA pseudouridine1911/1915/1917 synthase
MIPIKHPQFSTIFEDVQLLAVNKPAGLVCHPTKQGEDSSLIGQLRTHYQKEPQIQPALLHRLDRETSGVLLVSKTLEARRALQKKFETAAVQKEYLAIVHGMPRDESGMIDAPIGPCPATGCTVAIRQAVIPDGRTSRTEWWIEKRSNQFALLRLRPHTGRLHQIRVHLASIGHPVVGDKIYGGDEMLYLKFIRTGMTPELRERLLMDRHALHAARLTLREGWVGTPLSWTAPLPQDMKDFAEANGLTSCPSPSLQKTS